MRALIFLIDSGIAIVSIVANSIDDNDEKITITYVMRKLRSAKKRKDIQDIIMKISIQLVTPLYYTQIGEEIIDKYGFSFDVLEKGDITGKLVEVYLSGALAYSSYKRLFYYEKLNDSNLGEVDIYEDDKLLLMESTIQNKKTKDINVANYFENLNCIRVCSSKDKDSFNNDFYSLPYPKLMCMIYNGDIFKLKKTNID